MFVKIGKPVTKGKENYWNSVFESLIFFDVNDKITKEHADNFNYIIANYGVNAKEIAVNRIDDDIIYGLKSDDVEAYFIFKNKIIIPLWKS